VWASVVSSNKTQILRRKTSSELIKYRMACGSRRLMLYGIISTNPFAISTCSGVITFIESSELSVTSVHILSTKTLAPADERPFIYRNHMRFRQTISNRSQCKRERPSRAIQWPVGRPIVTGFLNYYIRICSQDGASIRASAAAENFQAASRCVYFMGVACHSALPVH